MIACFSGAFNLDSSYYKKIDWCIHRIFGLAKSKMPYMIFTFDKPLTALFTIYKTI